MSADLVLTDINMPEMDGLEFARHALKLPQPPVVIFTTAHDEHAVQAFELSAVDYLMKPVRMQRLLVALEKVPRLKPLSAARLEQLNKEYGTRILVSESTHEACGDGFAFRGLGNVSVRGRMESAAVYTIDVNEQG